MEDLYTLLVVEIDQDRFDTAGDAKLAIDMVEVGLHGIERNTQLICNIFIATPGCGAREDRWAKAQVLCCFREARIPRSA